MNQTRAHHRLRRCTGVLAGSRLGYPWGIEPQTDARREARHAAPRATCTDSSTPAPECTQRTLCAGFPGHDPVHGPADPGNRT
jgi:hypothetical protein